MKTYSFWDMEPFESDLYTRVKVTGTGLRCFQRYYGVETRGCEPDFSGSDQDNVDVSPTWTEPAAWITFVLVLAIVPVVIFLGMGKLL